MSWLKEVDNIYNKYFKKPFEEYNLKEYEHLDGNGMGGLRKYSNHLLKAQLLNDRGIITFELSPIFGDETFIEFEFIMRYFLMPTEDKFSSFQLAKLKNKRYAFSEQVEFLTDHWDKIVDSLSKDKYKTTISKIYQN